MKAQTLIVNVVKISYNKTAIYASDAATIDKTIRKVKKNILIRKEKPQVF